MKAIVRRRYGPPDVLELQEILKPTAGDDEVLLRVHAASVNAADWEILTANPLYVRLFFGLLRPRIRILGSDIAGRVEAVGRNVTQFQPGDDVFGDIFGCGLGGFAEYVCVPQDAVLVPKPASLSFAEVAAVPQAAMLALQGVRDKGQLQPGQSVLINGAGGGVGTFAVQMAKLFGAEVTGVDSAGKLDLMRSVGADHVIDYTRQNFTQSGQRYDLILDVVGQRSILDFRHSLSPGGVYAMVGGSTTRLVQAMLLGPWISMTGRARMGILAGRPNKEDLAFIVNELVQTGKVAPVIDKRYTLSEVAEALRYLGQGHVKGKVVITM